MRTIISGLPEWIKNPLRRLRSAAKALPYYGKGRLCPVCVRSFRRFRKFGAVPREDAQCPGCDALERHRLLWLYLLKMTDLFDGLPKRMLHISPESCFESKLRKQLGNNYLTADLTNPRTMEKMDITSIDYPDQTFDVIYCSHVLEHVQDDKKAIRELYRVLKANGWAILLVPISADKTYEDPSIIDPKERLKAFDQEDHVRKYGPDYIDRLREAEFRVKVVKVTDFIQKDEEIRMGLTQSCGEIYYCTK